MTRAKHRACALALAALGCGTSTGAVSAGTKGATTDTSTAASDSEVGASTGAMSTTALDVTSDASGSSASSRGSESDASESGEPPEDDGALDVLTVNLRTPLTSPDDVDARTQIVADLILELQPDVVALQEVTEGGGLDNRAEVLAMLTGYEWRWSQTHDIVYAEGVGLLSRWPIVWDEAVELPHADLLGAVNRKVIGIGVDAPWGEVAAFSTHMTLDEDETVRADQAVTAFEFVDARRTAVPGVLAGDTNATPDTLAMQVLRGDATHDGITGDLTDGWLATHPGDPGLTFPATAPDSRIDYVYGLGGTAFVAAVTHCQRHLERPVNGVMASDHLAVSCRIAMRR